MQSMLNELQQAVTTYGPKIITALVIFVVAFIVAKIIAWIVSFLVGKIGIGNASSREELQKGAASAAFWVTMLIAIPLILEPLGMQGILAPLQDMVSKFLAFLPNLIGAILIFGIGYIVASVAKNAVTGVLSATNVDGLASRVGISQGDIAKTVGMFVFIMIIVPIAISALDALHMDTISEPAKSMLQSVMDAIPNIIGAGIVLALAYYIAQFTAKMLRSMLPTLGVDSIGEKIGLDAETGGTSVSDIIANIAFAAIMIFGLIEAAKILNFEILSQMMTQILELGGHILLGTAIIMFGVFAATKLSDMVSKSKSGAGYAGLIKGAIIVLAVAMGLRQMGIANDIVTMGFTLMIGALSVGAAIAIGLGGKDAAAKVLNKWASKF